MENPAKYLSSVQAIDSVPAPLGEIMWNSTETEATNDGGKDMVVRTVTGCLLSLLILWTLLGNILVCAAVLRFRHLRTKVTNIFIVSLALSDLFVAVLVMPWKALNWHKASAEDEAGTHNSSTSRQIEENCDSSLSREPATDRDAGLPCVSETTFDVFVWFGWTNSSLNPIIYAFNAEFRKAFASLLGCRNFCSNTPVETVNISNELVSYNQDTLIHKEIANAYVNMIPNVVECIEHEETFDRISQFSHNNENATDSVCDLEDCEADISLDRMSPFTPNGLHLTPTLCLPMRNWMY
ncbi:D(1B) dopamine receptor D(5) dopamine receptor [Collichthys lucidus]|uniref:D(1B) dopamine receptor n=1 Tax=Collichthys lucidus TaxID=240159 RepID=A0A4U5U9B4_COLLU|nr:D(1B) dopamine receptor D(5) dopamine receptor [Collichthys lucidus]